LAGYRWTWLLGRRAWRVTFDHHRRFRLGGARQPQGRLRILGLESLSDQPLAGQRALVIVDPERRKLRETSG